MPTPKIPIIDPLEKSWEELDQFRPAVIEEVHRLFNAPNSNDILLERTKENKLDGLARRELVEILRKLSKEAFIFLIQSER